jgi:hypothetical protein
MITRTALQLITDSLKLLGAIAGDEVPIAQEQQDGLLRLNEFIDSLGLHAQTLLVLRRDVMPLVIGKQTYTIGPGADVSIPTPIDLDAVSYLIPGTTPTEVFLDSANDQAWIAQPQKTLSGAVTLQVNYSRTHGPGELWVWPVPSVVSSLVLYWHEPMAQFPDLTTPVSLATGYAKMLRTNLAVELASEFGKQLDPLVDRMARESLADVKRANVAPVEVGIDPALTSAGPGYNILSDQ